MSTRSSFNHIWILVLLVILYTMASVSISLAAGSVAPLQQADTPTATNTYTPRPTATPTPTANPDKPFVAKLGGPLLFDFPTPKPVSTSGPISGEEELSTLDKSSMATVKLVGCDQTAAPSCTLSQGSGTIIHPKGLILTVLHAVIEDPDDLASPILPEVSVAMLEAPNESARPIYRARVVAIEPELDLALLWIIRLPDDPDLFLPTLPIKYVTTVEIITGRWRIMGFPAGQQRLKQREAQYYDMFDGKLEIGATKIQQGFSGGPLLIQNEERLYEGGVVYYHTDDDIWARSVEQLRHLRWLDTPTPRLWAENIQIKPVVEDGLAEIQLSVNIHAIDLAGNTVQLEVLAFNVETNESWSPNGSTYFFPLKKIYPTRFIDAIPVELNNPLVGDSPVPERLRFVLRLRSIDESLPVWRDEVFYVHYSANPPTTTPTSTLIATYTPTPTTTASTQIATQTSTPTPTPTDTPTSTSAASSLPFEVEILLSEWDRIHHDTDHTMDTSELSSVFSRFGHFSCWLRRINGETIIDKGWDAKESQYLFLQIRQWRQVAKSLPIGDDLR